MATWLELRNMSDILTILGTDSVTKIRFRIKGALLAARGLRSPVCT